MLQAGDPPPDEASEDADRSGRARVVAGAGVGSARGRLAAFDEAVAEIAARVESAYGQADGWLERTRAALVELLRFCDEKPTTARALVIESIAWGPEVLERRVQLLNALAAALDRGCEEIDPARVPPPETAENLVGACVSLVHTRLLEAEGGSFLELAPSLTSMIAHPYLGPGPAKHELERPLRKLGAEVAGRESERPFSAVREGAW